MAKDLTYFYLESPTRGYVSIGFRYGLNMDIIFGTIDPTLFKSRQKCEDVAKALRYQVVDLEVKETDGMEDWYIKLLARYAI